MCVCIHVFQIPRYVFYTHTHISSVYTVVIIEYTFYIYPRVGASALEHCLPVRAGVLGSGHMQSSQWGLLEAADRAEAKTSHWVTYTEHSRGHELDACGLLILPERHVPGSQKQCKLWF